MRGLRKRKFQGFGLMPRQWRGARPIEHPDRSVSRQRAIEELSGRLLALLWQSVPAQPQ